jgi:diguanylate cyclase (GGDEF)-like protein
VPFQTPHGDRALSASIGVVTCSSGEVSTVENIIRQADQAMYQAKMEGKARIVCMDIHAGRPG